MQWPNASAANFFGLSRYVRAQGIEAGTLTLQVPHDQWQESSGDLKGCMQQGERTVIEVVKNPEWIDGSAVHYYFTSTMLGFNDTALSLFKPLLISPFVFVITWGTTVAELLLAAALPM